MPMQVLSETLVEVVAAQTNLSGGQAEHSQHVWWPQKQQGGACVLTQACQKHHLDGGPSACMGSESGRF